MRDTGKEDRIETYKGTVEEQPGTDMTAPQKSDIWQGGLPSRRKKRGMPRAVALVIVLAVLAGAAGGGYVLWHRFFKKSATTVAYREETVQNGPLTVGFSESGTLTVGTSEQDFDLDLSAYTGSTTSGSSSSSQNNMMGGGFGFGGNTNTNSSSSTTSSGTRELTVEKVLITQGQEIAAGDAIATLESDSIESIRSDLTADVSNAQLALDTAKTTQDTTDQTAENDLKTYETYGTYAQTELDSTVSDLQEAVDAAQQALDDDNESLTELEADLSDDETKLAEYKKLVENAEYAKSTFDETDTSQLYEYISAENQRESAQSLYDDMEDSIDTLNDEITSMQSTIAADQRTLNAAQESLESGTAEAQATYDTKMLYYDNSKSYYNATTSQSSLNTEIAQSDYDSAADKLSKFNAAISSDNSIVSAYSGIVEAVEISAGDTLATGSVLLSANDYDDMTIAVDVPDDEMDSVKVGDSVVVSIDAFPDTGFTGKVSEIGSSSYNSSTEETTYAVTILLDNADSTLYNGMTTEVTFVTKETETVLYIPNRAITRENGKSYCYVKNSSGDPEKREITTGFSDGTDTEVKEGLSEGETVLIESKVSGS
jgi:HlyD family secretion protein